MPKSRIKQLIQESKRLGKKITQADLAKVADVTQTSIYRIANNKIEKPSYETLKSIADLFTRVLGREVAIDDLIVDASRNGSRSFSAVAEEQAAYATKLVLQQRLKALRQEIDDILTIVECQY